jgi:hypothetical protein
MTDREKERTERAGDPKVSAAYRELGAEEPPRALDDAILAAARRSARPWTKRWAVPLSLAAVIVLSVTVTLRIQHEQPGIESPVQQAAAPPVAEKEAVKEVAKPAAADEVKIARRKPAEQIAPSLAVAPSSPEPKPFATDQAVASARSDESRGAAASVAGALAKRAEVQATPQALKQAESPERDIERIAELRGQGRHDEADRALTEFRKRYPEFRISEAMRERIERR